MAVGGKSTKRVSKALRIARGRKSQLNFTIDCTKPVEDGFMDSNVFEKFLAEHIKVEGKAGVLKDKVSITKTKTKISVTAKAPFSKRYLKYLTKKYLKKHNLRDWLHVVSTNKNTYELRYFVINSNEDDEEQDD